MSQGATGGKGAPAPPDFNKAALTQSQLSGQNVNTQTAQNRPDQTNAYGSTTSWTTGADGRPTQTQSFGGPTAGTASELQQQLLGANAAPLDNGQQARTAATNAIYGQETSRLDPQWDQQQKALTSSLANAGLDPSSEAGQAATGNFDRAKNDAYTSALHDAIMGGGTAAQQQQQLDLNSRMAPEQQLSGLQSLLTQPGFASAGMAETPQLLPAAQAQYSGDLQNYGIGQQGKNSTMGGLMNLGGTLGAASLLGPAAPAALAPALLGRGA